MDLYHHDGQGNIYDMDGSGTITIADTIEESRKRDRESDDEDTGGTGGQAPVGFEDGLGGGGLDDPFDFGSPPGTQPPADGGPPAYSVTLPTVQDVLDVFRPLIAAIIYDNHDPNAFTHMDQTNHVAAAAWNALPANQGPDGTVHAWSQSIADALNLAGHAITFSGMAVRRDLVGDGYHDTTGDRLWTQAQYDYLYSHPSLGTKSQLIAHLAAIVNLKQILKTDVDSAPSATYEGRLLYYTGMKTQFDGFQQYAQETYDNTSSQVNLDYLNAYIGYSSYLLVATNYHIGTMASWRPTTMPDIITIAAGGGHFQHTTALERMVHYKLGTPQFFDSEQINAGSWNK